MGLNLVESILMSAGRMVKETPDIREIILYFDKDKIKEIEEYLGSKIIKTVKTGPYIKMFVNNKETGKFTAVSIGEKK